MLTAVQLVYIAQIKMAARMHFVFHVNELRLLIVEHSGNKKLCFNSCEIVFCLA